jgi:mutual gliding-motility protein MglA
MERADPRTREGERMALINHRSREIHFKIVYVGPGLCGKTTNLECLHRRLPKERRGRMISIATDHDRTLFFDFMPVELGQVNGFVTRFHLYTVPGQVHYRLSRRAVLQGADAVVFVADSHPAREGANHESMRDLEQNLRDIGLTPGQLARLPRIVQYNKRDLSVAVAVSRLRAALNPHGAPEVQAIATKGIGVAETLKFACRAVLARLAGTASAIAPVARSDAAPTIAPAAHAGTAAPGDPSAPAGTSPPAPPVSSATNP